MIIDGDVFQRQLPGGISVHRATLVEASERIVLIG